MWRKVTSFWDTHDLKLISEPRPERRRGSLCAYRLACEAALGSIDDPILEWSGNHRRDSADGRSLSVG
jgi:hypothetical protein